MNRVTLFSNMRVGFRKFSSVVADRATNTHNYISPKTTVKQLSSQSQVEKYSIGRKKYWKEAASLMIVAKDNDSFTNAGIEFDYNVLFMKRQGGGNAFGGASVFPGGVVDDADFSPKWLQYFEKLGIKNLSQFGWAHMEGKQRAGPLAASREPGLLPNDVAFRICAIRETFEESGILIADKPANVMQSILDVENKQFSPATFHPDLSPEEFLEWRDRVYKDANQFLVMCQELDVFPNLWALIELSNSLTPRASSRRYDTVFYVSTFDVLPSITIDEREMENKQWLTPAEGLKLHCQGDIFLVPPQFLECSRFLNFPKMTDVQSYAAKIMDEGKVISLPVGFYLKDCLLHTLPGDDCYPKNVSLASISEIPKLDETEEENLRRVKALHRITFFPDRSFTFRCNITLPHGEHPPRNINSKEWLQGHNL